MINNFSLVKIIIFFSLTALPFFSVFAFNYNNIPASIVIGQQDFTSGLLNQGGVAGPNTFRNPAGTLVIGNKLLVADSENNRVLIFNQIPTTSNASADVVIGQLDFTSGTPNQTGIPETTQNPTASTLDRPSALATDGTKLFLLDRDNHRVLIYNQIPTTSNAEADVVIGHDSMTDRSYGGESAFNDTVGLSATKLSSGPTGIAYDTNSGKLVVYDSDNDRVLIYNNIPTTNGAAANVVIGQPDFTHNTTNQGGPVGANTLDLSTAGGVTTYNGKLFITDRVNNRILIFNQIPTTNNASADVVIGQPDFTQASVNQGGSIAANTLDNPRGVQVDSEGRLFIADYGNSRMLIFNHVPTTNNASADIVIGQADFSTGIGSTTNKTFLFPGWNASFFENQLIANDIGNHRYLIFLIGSPSFGTVTDSSIEIIQPSIVSQADPSQYQWRVRRNGNTALSLKNVATISVTDTSLAANTLYAYDVNLDNGTSFVGDYGSSASTRTLAGTPTNLFASSNSNSIALSVDNFPNDTSGLSGYYFSRPGANSGWIQDNSWQDTGLTCDTQYAYSVKYRNNDGVETDTISTTKSTSDCSGGSRRVGMLNVPTSSTPTITVCRLGDSFSSITGLPCTSYTATPAQCLAGDLFNSSNGLPCVSNKIPLTQCSITDILKVGSRGDQVKCLQMGLSIFPDGIFGPLTKASVIIFQESKDLISDGIFGPKTYAAWLEI